MYLAKILACTVIICASLQTQSQTSAPARRVVIAASTILDGKGNVIKNTRIVIEGDRIVAFDPMARSMMGPGRGPKMPRPRPPVGMLAVTDGLPVVGQQRLLEARRSILGLWQ